MSLVVEQKRGFLHRFVLLLVRTVYMHHIPVRRGGQLQESVRFSHLVGPRDQIQTARLGCKCLSPLIHLIALFSIHLILNYDLKNMIGTEVPCQRLDYKALSSWSRNSKLISLSLFNSQTNHMKRPSLQTEQTQMKERLTCGPESLVSGSQLGFRISSFR